MQVLLTGATGAVGRDLAPALVAAGHSVVAATRAPAGWTGPGRAVTFDLDRSPPARARSARDADVAYYLVHALDRAEVEGVDRARAERFARWWGPDRPVAYLGGLGPEDAPSTHLRSRHEVGAILRERCRTVELRASIVLGPDSLSFRLLRAVSGLAGRVPLPLPVPSASATRTQPIAQHDLTEALVGALDLTPGRYDVGGPEAVTFAELLERTAAAAGRRLRAVPRVPIGADWFGPAASLLAGVDPWATTTLLASMGTETTVDDACRPAGPDGSATGLDAALSRALAGRPRYGHGHG